MNNTLKHTSNMIKKLENMFPNELPSRLISLEELRIKHGEQNVLMAMTKLLEEESVL